jgi:RNA polymerase sigma-70 factor (ECF subfamily)
VLTYANELTHEEAAAVLDCPVGTLKTHVARAKEKLRRQLEEVP